MGVFSVSYLIWGSRGGEHTWDLAHHGFGRSRPVGQLLLGDAWLEAEEDCPHR